MKKPKYLKIGTKPEDFPTLTYAEIKYNEGLQKMEEYYQWYIKEYCVRKEDLPDEKGWFEICYAVVETSELCENWDDFIEQKALDLASSLAKQIAERIGKEVK